LRLLTALLYMATSLVITVSYLLFTGTMLGMTTPILTLRNTLTSSVYTLGPSMLLLSGAILAFEKSRRSVVSLVTGGAFLVGLSWWTVPRIGWQYASQLEIYPYAISLFVGGALVFKIERRWISATAGSALSAPFFVSGAGYLVYRHILQATTPSFPELIWIFIPALLVILALWCALHYRRA
jgi:hypothetical protein